MPVHTEGIDGADVTLPFVDREDAGRRLGARVATLHLVEPVVLGLPRGGVPVAAEVARALRAPLDVAVVRKIRTRAQPELAIGAVGEDDTAIYNARLIRACGLRDETIHEAAARARVELADQEARWRGSRPAVTVRGRTAVIVDDGLATGATARVAAQIARHRGATRVVVAVPVAPSDIAETFAGVADDLVCLATPEPFEAVGRWYRDFRPTSSDEVTRLLAARN